MFDWLRQLLGMSASAAQPVVTHTPHPTTSSGTPRGTAPAKLAASAASAASSASAAPQALAGPAGAPSAPSHPAPAAPELLLPNDLANWEALRFNAQTAALRWVFGVPIDSSAPGSGGAATPDGPTLGQLADTIERTSLDTHRAADWVPRVPKVLPSLLHSLRDEHHSARDLAALIEQDVTLLAEALKEANSALHQRSTPVTGTDEAVQVLGVHGLRLLVARVAFRPVLGPDAGPRTRHGAQRVWELAQACAQASRDLAPGRGLDPFEAYLGALAFNVGQLVALRMADRVAHLAKPSAHDLARHSIAPDDDRACESDNQAAQDMAHTMAILAHRVAARWELPDNVVGAITAQVDQVARCHWPEAGELLGVAQETARLQVLHTHGLLPAALDDCTLHLPDDARAWLTQHPAAQPPGAPPIA
jgi:HD-like signal output (HDOD) protein